MRKVIKFNYFPNVNIQTTYLNDATGVIPVVELRSNYGQSRVDIIGSENIIGLRKFLGVEQGWKND